MELIKVTTNNNGEQLVSARELHGFLEVKTPYKKWFDRMCEYGFVENIDFVTVGQKCPIANGGYQESTDHVIKLDMAKEISMIQRTEKGKQARKYFIECEKKLKEIAQPKLPQTYLEALKELVKVEEEKLMLENKVKNLTHQNKLYTATEIAKELGFKSASEFNKVLEADKIQYKVNGTWVLCARLAEKGYVSIKQMELDSGKVIYDRKFTGIGRDFLIEKYGKKIEG